MQRKSRFPNPHAALASQAQTALGQGNIDLAVDLIDQCFSLPNDGRDDPRVGCYLPRALVYLEAYRREPERYRDAFFESLYVLAYKAGKHSKVRIADADLTAYLTDPAYLAYKMAKPVEQLRTGPAGETWQAALVRFRALADELHLVQHSPLDERYFSVEAYPVTAADIDTLEAEDGCTVPASLRALYLEHGSIGVQHPHTLGSLRLYSRGGERLPPFGGFVDMIDSVWGGRPEFYMRFDEDEIDELNARFFIFGHLYHNDGQHTYCAFDREGKFGLVLYRQYDWDEMEALAKRLLDGTLVFTESLDAILSAQIDTVIALLLDRDDDERAEA